MRGSCRDSISDRCGDGTDYTNVATWQPTTSDNLVSENKMTFASEVLAEGDLVRLNSGGPWMTIHELKGGGANSRMCLVHAGPTAPHCRLPIQLTYQIIFWAPDNSNPRATRDPAKHRHSVLHLVRSSSRGKQRYGMESATEGRYILASIHVPRQGRICTCIVSTFLSSSRGLLQFLGHRHSESPCGRAEYAERGLRNP